MIKLLTAIIMISLSTIMIAKEIDLDKSKGTDQERIVTLHPNPQSLEVAEDIMIQVTFDVALDAKHVKKNDITLEKLSEKKKKKIKGAVVYLADEKAVTFKPELPLEVGYYEIKIKSLKHIKEEKEKKIKEITYRFYVPEVINGYMLPSEPDATINNSTMLGIDSNDNGVRDDVERWIYHTYTHPIEIGIFMQSARAYQKVIVDPSRAKETTKYLRNASSCEFYWVDRGNSNNEAFSINRYRDLEDEIRGIQFNTVERFMGYQRYNAEFHGEVFGAPPTSKDKCEFNSNGILKDLP